MIGAGSLLAGVPSAAADEIVTALASRPGAIIERIVSTGQTSPPGFWCDQDWDEWVLVVAGSADVRIEGEAAPRRLGPGDWLDLPAHVRHRVERTETPTVWLAVHWR